MTSNGLLLTCAGCPVGIKPTRSPRQVQQLVSVPSARVPEGLKPSDLLRSIRPHCVPQIPILLQPKPEIGAHPGNTGQAESGVGCNGPPAIDYFVQAREGDVQSRSECGLGDPEGLEEFFEQHFAGVSRRAMRR